MASNSEIASRWAEQVGTEKPSYIGKRSSNNVYVDRERLFSYGPHFELGRLVGSRTSGFFLLNGDNYSVTTNRHQSIVRDAVAQTGIPSVIVPFTALAAAGIELDSIRPLEILPERFDRWTEDIGPAWKPGDPNSESRWQVGHDSEYPFPPHQSGLPGYVARRWDMPGSGIHAIEVLRGWDYFELDRYNARDYRGGWRNYRPGEKVEYYSSEGSGVKIIDDRFHVDRHRHWLGASLFSARVTGRKGRRKFLSAFDENETRPLYFLCELPRTDAKTVDEARNALAPRIVHAALAQGRTVERQGDIFAIPTNFDKKTLRKRGAEFSKRSNGGATLHGGRWIPNEEGHKLLGTDHGATEVARIKGAVYARGCLYHDVTGWRTPDHRRRKMADGKTWHLIAKNTVPRVRQGGGISAGRAL